MKKYYVGLPIVITLSIMCIIGILGFLWESLDVGKFVLFAFLTSVVMPLSLETIIIIIFCKYITIDKFNVKKYFFKRKLVEFEWKNIKEIRVDEGWIYISIEKLNGEKKFWDKKKYICVMFSDRLINELKKHINNDIINNL